MGVCMYNMDNECITKKRSILHKRSDSRNTLRYSPQDGTAALQIN